MAAPTVPALTTIYTPPPACLSGFHLAFEDGVGPVLAIGITTAEECHPPGYTRTKSANWFSPGRCPSGYVGSVAFASSVTANRPTITVVSSETIQTCCPSGYVVNSVGPYGCVSVFDPISTITTGTTYIRLSHTIRTAFSNFKASVAYANSVQIRFRAADFAADNGPTTSNSGRSQKTKSGNLQTAKTGHKVKKSGLNGGEIAGIVVGAICGFLLLLVGAFQLFRRRRRRRRRPRLPAQNSPGLEQSENYPEVELDGQPVVQTPNDPAELDGRGIIATARGSELADQAPQSNAIELEERSIPNELPSKAPAPSSALPD